MSWAPGTIVRCIDASPAEALVMTRGALFLGELYTVRFYTPLFAFDDDHAPAVWLNEVERIGLSPPPVIPDFPFGAFRFVAVEGGTCEAERARAMKQQEQRK